MDIKSQNRHKIPTQKNFWQGLFICEYVFYIKNVVLRVNL